MSTATGAMAPARILATIRKEKPDHGATGYYYKNKCLEEIRSTKKTVTREYKNHQLISKCNTFFLHGKTVSRIRIYSNSESSAIKDSILKMKKENNYQT